MKPSLLVLTVLWSAGAAEKLPPNGWVRLEKAHAGSRSDPALVYDGAGKRFLLLGGGISWPRHAKPRPYDDLALDVSAGVWENLYPAGKSWGPKVGACKPPRFRNERWGLGDVEGNVRPNVATYRGVFYYHQYAYSPDHKRTFFLARGSTFGYDAAARTWRDLAPVPSPDAAGGMLLWGSMCYDPVNRKVLLFGGGNVRTRRGDPGTWTYDPATNTWNRLELARALLRRPLADCAGLAAKAERLAAGVRARYFRADLPEDRKTRPQRRAAELIAALGVLERSLAAARAKADRHEKGQVSRALEQIAAAADALKQLQGLSPGARSIGVADAATRAVASARDALSCQPPQRALSRMVYDASTKRIVLFGGDHLDRLLADTWVFDCAAKRWIEMRPPLSPAPRAGHAMVYLPAGKKVLLFGGCTYTSSRSYCGRQYRNLPFEMWTYDTSSNRWSLLQRVEAPQRAPQGQPGRVFPAAVDDRDVVVALQQLSYHKPPVTWLCRVDASAAVGARAEHGVKPGTVTERTGPFVPAYYDAAPAPDATAAEARLKALRPNTWTRIEPPRAPGLDRCWGTAAYSPDHDVILHWSGGHSSHCGTEGVRYHPGINRWSLAAACELPLEFVYSNDGTPGQWSFQQRPWMTGHTYKSYGYDPRLRRMVFAGKNDRTYFFDPAAGDWERRTTANPFRGSFYTTTIISTPDGAVVWAQRLKDSTKTALWRMEAPGRTWRALPLEGKLPRVGPDRHSGVYDSRRGRILLFSEHTGDVTAYDPKTGRAAPLGAAGKELAKVRSREAVYLPECDRVLLGAHVGATAPAARWPVYDCARNAWFAAVLAGTDPVGKGRFNVSLGLCYDRGRKLVWALGQRSEVTVLRFDAKSAALEPLKQGEKP